MLLSNFSINKSKVRFFFLPTQCDILWGYQVALKELAEKSLEEQRAWVGQWELEQKRVIVFFNSWSSQTCFHRLKIVENSNWSSERRAAALPGQVTGSESVLSPSSGEAEKKVSESNGKTQIRQARRSLLFLRFIVWHDFGDTTLQFDPHSPQDESTEKSEESVAEIPKNGATSPKNGAAAPKTIVEPLEKNQEPDPLLQLYFMKTMPSAVLFHALPLGHDVHSES